MAPKATPLGEELLAMRKAFLSQMIFQIFNGYAMPQFKEIEQDIRNHGDRIARSACRDEEGKTLRGGRPANCAGNTPSTCGACSSPARRRCATPACPCASRRFSNEFA